MPSRPSPSSRPSAHFIFNGCTTKRLILPGGPDRSPSVDAAFSMVAAGDLTGVFRQVVTTHRHTRCGGPDPAIPIGSETGLGRASIIIWLLQTNRMHLCFPRDDDLFVPIDVAQTLKCRQKKLWGTETIGPSRLAVPWHRGYARRAEGDGSDPG